MSAINAQICLGIMNETVTTKTRNVTDPNIRFYWKNFVEKIHCFDDGLEILTLSLKKYFQSFFFDKQIYKFDQTRILSQPFIKVSSTLNKILSIFNYLIHLMLFHSSNRAAWSISLTSFHIVTWCLAKKNSLRQLITSKIVLFLYWLVRESV